MTPRTFCQSGASEGVKGAVHGVMLVGAVACCAYNVVALITRKQDLEEWQRHLVLNVALYGALTIIETKQVVRHVTHHAQPVA